MCRDGAADGVGDGRADEQEAHVGARRETLERSFQCSCCHLGIHDEEVVASGVTLAHARQEEAADEVLVAYQAHGLVSHGKWRLATRGGHETAGG